MESNWSVYEIQKVLKSGMNYLSKLEKLKTMSRCDVCEIDNLSVQDISCHLNGQKHLRNLKRKKDEGVDPIIIEYQMTNTKKIASELHDLLMMPELDPLHGFKQTQIEHRKKTFREYQQRIHQMDHQNKTLKEENGNLKAESMKFKQLYEDCRTVKTEIAMLNPNLDQTEIQRLKEENDRLRAENAKWKTFDDSRDTEKYENASTHIVTNIVQESHQGVQVETTMSAQEIVKEIRKMLDSEIKGKKKREMINKIKNNVLNFEDKIKRGFTTVSKKKKKKKKDEIWCDICEIMIGAGNYEQHLKGKKHIITELEKKNAIILTKLEKYEQSTVTMAVHSVVEEIKRIEDARKYSSVEQMDLSTKCKRLQTLGKEVRKMHADIRETLQNEIPEFMERPKKTYCNVCECEKGGSIQLLDHIVSKKHITKLQQKYGLSEVTNQKKKKKISPSDLRPPVTLSEIENVLNSKMDNITKRETLEEMKKGYFWCDICYKRVRLSSWFCLSQHLGGKAHRTNLSENINGENAENGDSTEKLNDMNFEGEWTKSMAISHKLHAVLSAIENSNDAATVKCEDKLIKYIEEHKSGNGKSEEKEAIVISSDSETERERTPQTIARNDVGPSTASDSVPLGLDNDNRKRSLEINGATNFEPVAKRQKC